MEAFDHICIHTVCQIYIYTIDQYQYPSRSAKDARITSVFDLALSVCLFVRINVEISGVAMHTLTTKNSPKLTHTAQNGHAYTLEIIFYIYINKFRVRISSEKWD